MKKLFIGFRNQLILPRSTIRLEGSVHDRMFRPDRLVIKCDPVGAKVVINDVRTPGTTLIAPYLRAPLPIASFVASAPRSDNPIVSVEMKRGTDISVVVTSLDPRTTRVSVWMEQLESEDLS